MISVKNNCACVPPSNGRSDATCCTGVGALVSARITASGEVTPVSSVAYDGVGPIHMAVHPNWNLAIADYIGGTGSVVGPLDPSTGVISPDVHTNEKLADRSLWHMVTTDDRCGPDRRLLAITPPSS